MRHQRDMTCMGPPPVRGGRRGEMHHRRAAAAGVAVGEQAGEVNRGVGQEERAGGEERGQLVDDQRLFFRNWGSGTFNCVPYSPPRLLPRCLPYLDFAPARWRVRHQWIGARAPPARDTTRRRRRQRRRVARPRNVKCPGGQPRIPRGRGGGRAGRDERGRFGHASQQPARLPGYEGRSAARRKRTRPSRSRRACPAS